MLTWSNTKSTLSTATIIFYIQSIPFYSVHTSLRCPDIIPNKKSFNK